VIKLDAKLIIKSGFGAALLGAVRPNLMIDVFAAVTWCDVALPLFGSGRLDQTGSSRKAGLIAVFCERRMWIKREAITINYSSLN
jgi:hypothetical protein